MNSIGHKRIVNVQGLIAYIGNNSAWSTATIRNVINALGFRSNGGMESLKGLSTNLADCVKHGADGGFPGFTYYSGQPHYNCFKGEENHQGAEGRNEPPRSKLRGILGIALVRKETRSTSFR
jgi:hypothetical protein